MGKGRHKQAIPKLDAASRVLGYTLLCIQDNSHINMNTGLPIGKITEIDPNKKALDDRQPELPYRRGHAVEYQGGGSRTEQHAAHPDDHG